MSKAPLELNWKELLSARNEAPPPELEVVSTAPAAAGAELSEREIEDKIQRLQDHISRMASKLPDKGDKLRQTLQQHQVELDRRKLVRFQKVEENQARQATSSGVSVSHDVPSPNYTKSEPRQKTFFSFSKKLDCKADATSKEESMFISREKCGSLGKNREQKYGGSHPNRVSLQHTRTSVRQTQFQCASSIASRDRYRFSNGDPRIAEVSEVSYSHVGNNFLVHSPKKRTALESRDSLHPRSNKVQHVVLLDEEEVATTQPIHNDAHAEWKEVKFYYPSRDDPESIELSFSDIKCLDPGQYLSSPIMNFYIRYLQRPISPTGETCGGYYFFNTYFYKKLDEAMFCKGDCSARFSKLRRWWKGVNIFEKAYIFLPIHNQLHWSLVIICIPTNEDESVPIVLHLDSLGLHESERIFDVIDSCLKQEWKCISRDVPPDVPISENTWKDLTHIENKKIMVPQQKNEYDCGLFVLYFMERFIKEAPKRLQKKDLSSMFGRKWFEPEDASGLRERIRDLLVEEFENARLENGRQTESPTSSSGFPENDTDHCDEP